eukprot:TRINITY_DN8377_c0_g2_i1.p1 TRINITY_DN8377_c0_g2~~TRINITY_DN8377_c0_g2_i1.p1  ORF type:complete len:328 (-),score=35.43 TRINITY_DN8377_c0_g2_i1:166-1149(-)
MATFLSQVEATVKGSMSPSDMHHMKHGMTGPVSMGTICGLMHAIGPDHLATLVTFSTLMEPLAAAKVGAAWGAGHCVGLIFVGTLLLAFSRVLPQSGVDHWEYYGDYVVGLSMVIVALYFLWKEADYIETTASGEVVARPCGCSGCPPPVQRKRRGRPKVRFCTSGHEDCDGEHDSSDSHSHEDKDACVVDEEARETTPLNASPKKGLARPSVERSWFDTVSKSTKGAAVGLVQGLCCPMGFVSMTYLAGQGQLGIVIFLVIFISVSVLGTATVAALWAYLTTTRMASDVSPRLLYRGSCVMALCFGIAWMTANYFQVLDKINYAEH